MEKEPTEKGSSDSFPHSSETFFILQKVVFVITISVWALLQAFLYLLYFWITHTFYDVGKIDM